MDHDKHAKGGMASICEEAKPMMHSKRAGGGATMMNMGEAPGTPHKKRAKGGSAIQVYNAQGSAEMDAAKDEKPGFKKGGHPKRKAGGMAEGEKDMPRLDQRKRGGHLKRASGGGTPYSSGRNIEPPKGDKNMGHESDKPA